MRRLTALAAILAVGAVPLAGCGGSKAPGIPKRDATELLRLLRKAQAESDNPQQRCDSLLATVRKLEQKVAALPSKVDRDVRDTLTNGVKNLAASSASLCQQTQTTPTTPTTPTVPTTPTTPPPTTQTTPPPTTQTTPPPTTQTTPPPTTPPPTTPGTGGTGPGAGNGNGNGIGNGKRGFRRGGNGHRGGGD